MGLKFKVLNLLPHCTSILGYTYICYRGVAQLVARTAGGREVASSSLVIPMFSIIVYLGPTVTI